MSANLFTPVTETIMTITKITVSASAGFNHPFEQYANFKPGITLEAVIPEGENADLCARALQEKAQDLVDAERVRIEAECRHEKDIEDTQHAVDRWGSIVTSYENTLATVPAWLAENDGVVSSSGAEAASAWEISDKKRALDDAAKGIEEARAKLAESKGKLVSLVY